MKKLTPKQRLEIVEAMLTLSMAGEDVLMDVVRKRKRTPTEIELAEMLSNIYRIIHPAGTCKNPHDEWEKETREMLKLRDL